MGGKRRRRNRKQFENGPPLPPSSYRAINCLSGAARSIREREVGAVYGRFFFSLPRPWNGWRMDHQTGQGGGGRPPPLSSTHRLMKNSCRPPHGYEIHPSYQKTNTFLCRRSFSKQGKCYYMFLPSVGGFHPASAAFPSLCPEIRLPSPFPPPPRARSGHFSSLALSPPPPPSFP